MIKTRPRAMVSAAWGLTSMTIEVMSPVVDKYAPVIGRVSAWGLFTGVALAGNAVAAGVAFVTGRGLAIPTRLPV